MVEVGVLVLVEEVGIWRLGSSVVAEQRDRIVCIPELMLIRCAVFQSESFGTEVGLH